MKRVLLLIIFSLIIVCPFSVNCAAESKEISDIVPEDLKNILNEENTSTPAKLANTLSFSNIMSFIVKVLKSHLPQFTKLLYTVLAIIIFLEITRHLSGQNESQKLILSCFASISLLLLLYTDFVKLCDICTESIETVQIFCSASVPIISALLISGGKSISASLFSGCISLCSTITSALIKSVFLPLIRIFLAIGSCGALWEDVHISSLIDLIQKFIKWAVGIVFSVFTFSISLQSILVKNADNLAQKVLKTAAGSIPIFGGALSKGLDSTFVLATGSQGLSAGIGIGIIIMSFFGPAIMLALNTLALYLSCTIAQLFEQKESIYILKTVYKAYQLLLGIFFVSVIMCIMCFLLICMGAN